MPPSPGGYHPRRFRAGYDLASRLSGARHSAAAWRRNADDPVLAFPLRPIGAAVGARNEVAQPPPTKAVTPMLTVHCTGALFGGQISVPANRARIRSAAASAWSRSVSGSSATNSPRRSEGLVGSPQAPGNTFGECDQHLIALDVAPGVVELFEIVDVEHHQGQRVAIALATVHFLA